MVKNFDEMQQFGRDNMDATLKSFGALSKSAQAIAVEIADYGKKMFEQRMIDDCVAQGRRNCAPIDAPAR